MRHAERFTFVWVCSWVLITLPGVMAYPSGRVGRGIALWRHCRLAFECRKAFRLRSNDCSFSRLYHQAAGDTRYCVKQRLDGDDAAGLRSRLLRLFSIPIRISPAVALATPLPSALSVTGKRWGRRVGEMRCLRVPQQVALSFPLTRHPTAQQAASRTLVPGGKLCRTQLLLETTPVSE
jgi:hypothetical protein